MSLATRRAADLSAQRATDALRQRAALRCLRGAPGAGRTLPDTHTLLVRGGSLTAGTPLDVTRRTLRALVEQGDAVEVDGRYLATSATPRPAPAPPPAPEPPVTIDADDLVERVKREPGLTLSTWANRLGRGVSSVEYVVRNEPRLERRKDGTARTAPVRVYLASSPPSSSTPVAEGDSSAGASGGDLPSFLVPPADDVLDVAFDEAPEGSRITVTVGSGSTVRPTLGVVPPDSYDEVLEATLNHERRARAELTAALDEIATALDLPTTADTTEIVTAVHRAREWQARAEALADERRTLQLELDAALDWVRQAESRATRSSQEADSACRERDMVGERARTLQLELDAARTTHALALAETLTAERDALRAELDAARAEVAALRPTNPPPQGGRGDVWASLIASLADDHPMRAACVARREVGLVRYGQPLRYDDGRDASLDLVEELLDAAAYAWRLGGADLSWRLLDCASEL